MLSFLFSTYVDVIEHLVAFTVLCRQDDGVRACVTSMRLLCDVNREYWVNLSENLSLEYCAPVWHYGLTRTQAQQLEAVQKRSIHVILNLSRGMSYSSMLFAADLESLSDRRENLSRSSFLV